MKTAEYTDLKNENEYITQFINKFYKMSNLSTNQRATSQGVSALAATRAMEEETISKNAAPPKHQASRYKGKKALLASIFLAVAVAICHAQTSGNEIRLIQKGSLYEVPVTVQ